MEDYLNDIESNIIKINEIKDLIISNLILLGQIPAPTFRETKRSQFFIERLSELDVYECSTDDFGNPFCIIRGTEPSLPQIFLVAHMDTVHNINVEHNVIVEKDKIIGPGVADNSIGVATLMSLPEILKALNMSFKSDIVLSGTVQSLGRGNLRGINHLLQSWERPIRGAICVEGAELGRLSYLSDGMIRGRIKCRIGDLTSSNSFQQKSAILVLHKIIDKILKLNIPQKPRTNIIIGYIHGGVKYGEVPEKALLGFEVKSTRDRLVKKILQDIDDIVSGTGYEFKVDLKLEIISQTPASKLEYNHPLVKHAFKVLDKLKVDPIVDPSEAELSKFLSRKIPAITLGITHAKNKNFINEEIDIDPIPKGVCQILSVLKAIDDGVCDG